MSRNIIPDLYIPIDLVPKFEMLSKSNTDRGVETGGIIAGRHMDNYFQITHLIIPQQTAASDRREVEGERQITNYLPQPLSVVLFLDYPKLWYGIDMVALK